MFLGWGCIHTFPSLVGHEQLLPEPRTDPVSLINSSKTLNCLFSTNMTTETAALDANQLCLKWCGISYDCGSSLGKLIFLLMNWTRCNLTAEDARGSVWWCLFLAPSLIGKPGGISCYGIILFPCFCLQGAGASTNSNLGSCESSRILAQGGKMWR